MKIPRHILAIVTLVSIVAPLHVLGNEGKPEPRQQKFILTAYYSPLPDQCCYVLGGEGADKEMNGEGIAGADGTAVYPGMVAAPASYAFGTRITLPGIGIVTVHDRGGAITELPGGEHRIDVWVGFGEEGLARALAFGVQEVTGTVYEPGGWQPQERISFEALPSPPDRLRDYQVAAAGLLDVSPAKGERGLSVTLLQETLTKLGHDVAATGTYDDATEKALRAFLDQMDVKEPADHLTPMAAAYLTAATVTRRDPDINHIGPESSKVAIQATQRLLRFVGVYKGRTDGKYDGATAAAILAFQQSAGLVGGPDSPGAGRIGPLTKGKLADAWFERTVTRRAARYLLLASVAKKLDAKNVLPDRFMQEGVEDDDVTLLQNILADSGYFPREKVNGVYGPTTKASVYNFQKDHKLVKGPSDPAAGYVGPATLRELRYDGMLHAYKMVRSNGLAVL